MDDHELVRVGLRAVLGRYPHVAVVGEAANVQQGVQEALTLKPDVILMDVRMSDGTGFDACRQLRQHNLDSRVLFLTSYSDDEVLMQAVMVEADGFLLKDVHPDELVAAIEKVHAGQSILDPAVTRRVFEQLKRGVSQSAPTPLDQLSAQEKRVLALVAEGKTNKEIGLALGLSDKTVKNYLANAMEKLQINRRSQAAALFAQHHGTKGRS
ncbi:response regulator transcription factor [Fontisphaera persica]|uniref:response regulator n=1 Tax=Fontisphaera persica TaxID=2974023 RepID=UPI0024BF1CB6|nr:response regulator transcription factor [Fontisphaera persica]WCJ59160.1 response regulator transcription factor [Fontisphaera persica]